MGAGFRSYLSLLWIPDAKPPAPPPQAGFRSLNAMLWIPDAAMLSVPPSPGPTPPALSDDSRDYEKQRERSGLWSKFLPGERFGWFLGGGGTPRRH